MNEEQSETRLVISCLSCRLTQFIPANKHCRRCQKALCVPLAFVVVPKTVFRTPAKKKSERRKIAWQLPNTKAHPVKARPKIQAPSQQTPDFASCIKFTRQQLGISQTELSTLSGVVRTYISRVENRRVVRISHVTAKKIGFAYENIALGESGAAILFAAEKLIPDQTKEIIDKLRLLL